MAIYRQLRTVAFAESVLLLVTSGNIVSRTSSMGGALLTQLGVQHRLFSAGPNLVERPAALGTREQARGIVVSPPDTVVPYRFPAASRKRPIP
jgi:hypothetical protein